MHHPLPIAVIGCGRAGAVLLQRLVDAQAVVVQWIAVRTQQGCERVRSLFPGVPVHVGALPGVEGLNLIVAVPDDALTELKCEGLAARAIHLSGAHPGSVLAYLAASCGSLHPALAMAEHHEAVRRFADAPCAVEGEAVAFAEELARRAGGVPFRLQSHDKPSYHAACVLASNFPVVLAALAEGLLRVEPALARRLVGELVAQAGENVGLHGAQSSLTGPVVRGDVRTVAQHLSVLPPHVQGVYRELCRAALAMAELDESTHRRLRQLLDGDVLQAGADDL